jgi:hypothetical protein
MKYGHSRSVPSRGVKIHRLQSACLTCVYVYCVCAAAGDVQGRPQGDGGACVGRVQEHHP